MDGIDVSDERAAKPPLIAHKITAYVLGGLSCRSNRLKWRPRRPRHRRRQTVRRTGWRMVGRWRGDICLTLFGCMPGSRWGRIPRRACTRGFLPRTLLQASPGRFRKRRQLRLRLTGLATEPVRLEARAAAGRRRHRRQEWGEHVKLVELLTRYLDPATVFWTGLKNT